MYCDFFGLRCRPFEDRADTQFYFATPEHEEALATVEYEARYGQGMALLLGDPGTGKTLIIRMLLQRLSSSDKLVVLTWPASGQGDLVRETCKSFGVSLSPSHQSSRTVSRLRRHLKRTNKAGHRSVLLVDQAQNLTAQNLAQLETLTEFQQDKETLLSVILVGTPRFRDLLDRPEFGRIVQKLFGERIVPALTLAQTTAYIAHRLNVAGAGDQQPFTPDAVRLIHKASKGIPRLINRLCHSAMLASYGAGNSTIDREIASEITASERGVEHTVDARSLGLESAESVRTGWSADDRRDPIKPQPPSPATSQRSHVVDFTPSENDGSLAPIAFDGEFSPTPPAAPSIVTSAVASLDSHPSTSAASPTSSMISDMETLVNRLERATARAERIGTTTEASIAQYLAIEKHLGTLTANAERLIAGLAESIDGASGSTNDLESRLSTLLDAVDAKSKTMSERESEASQLSDELKEEIQNVRSACNEGQRVRTELTSFADELADKAHEVQSRMVLLVTGVESSEVAQRNLEGLIERISTVSSDADKRLSEVRGTASQVTKDAEARIDETAARRTRDAKDQLEKIGAAVVDESRVKLEEQAHRAEAAGQQAVDDCQTRLTAVGEEVRLRAVQTEEQIERLGANLDGVRNDIEKLMKRAGSGLLAELRTTVQQQLEQHQETIDEAILTATNKVDALSRRSGSVSSEAEEKLDRSRALLEDLRNEAKRFESEFSSALLARCREQLEQQFDCHLRSRQETIESALKRASGVAGDADRAVAALNKKLEEAKTDVDRFQREFTDDAIETFRKNLQSQVEAQLRCHDRTVENSLAAYRAEFENTIRELNPQAREIIERISAGRSEVETTLSTYERTKSELLSSMREAHGTLQEQTAELEGRRDAVAGSLQTLSKEISEASAGTSELTDTIQHVESTVDILTARAQTTQSGMSQLVLTVEKLVGEAHSVRGRLETLQHGASATLLEVGRAMEQVASAQELTEKTERITTRLASERTECEGAIRRLTEHAADVLDLIQRAEQLELKSREQSCALDTRLEQSRDVLDELSRTSTIAQSINEGMGDAICRAEASTEEAGRHRSRLESDLTAAQTLSTQLNEEVTSATQLHGAMQGIVAYADDKITRLDSHHAAATQMLRTISEANVSGRETLDRLIESKRKGDETAERIERLTGNACEVATATKARIESLTVRNEEARDLVTTLEDRREPAAETVEALNRSVAEAKQLSDDFDDRCAQATQLAERLNGITSAIQAAKDAENAIRVSHEEAQPTLDRLGEANEEADIRLTSLTEVKGSAHEITERCIQTQAEAEQAAERLTAHISAAEKSVEAGEPLLREFIEQTRSIGGLLRDFDTRCTQIDERFTAATAKPVEIITAAQAQAAQLERVCSAVRKIFAGLSKASLEAKQYISECRSTSETAANQSAQLTTQTDRAANTLHEWVQEATRVQSRLESTLDRAPSIRETHPGDALRRMSGLSAPDGRIGQAGHTGDLMMLAEPRSAESDVTQLSTPSPIHKRAEEVAQLIEDAKRSAESPAT